MLVAGSSKLVDVTYNGATVPYTMVDAHTWTTNIVIVAGGHRAIFTFATIQPETVDIYEVDAPPAPAVAAAVVNKAPPAVAGPVAINAVAAPSQQEIAGCTHVLSPILAPQIEGV